MVTNKREGTERQEEEKRREKKIRSSQTQKTTTNTTGKTRNDKNIFLTGRPPGKENKDKRKEEGRTKRTPSPSNVYPKAMERIPRSPPSVLSQPKRKVHERL